MPTTKKVQTTLPTPPVTCVICHMTYTPIGRDKQLHTRHHSAFVDGVSFRSKRAPIFSTAVRRVAVASPINGGSAAKPPKIGPAHQIRFYMINAANGPTSTESRLVSQLVSMANAELNAPEEIQYWRQTIKNFPVQGAAFLAVCNNKAVAVCTTDPVEPAQSRWMVALSMKLVPKQVNRSAKIGVSRIWVVLLFRRCGIASQLLRCVQQNLVYGTKLQPFEISFSQPSTAGGKLAATFNGVKHKSGELLLPVYIDRDEAEQAERK